jgi:hypothetical protein
MSIVDTVREPLVVLDAKLRLKPASKAFFDKFAVSAEGTSRSENERKRRFALTLKSRLARGLMVRELRVIEMKKEVNQLCHRLGEVGHYILEFEQDGKERPDSPRPRNQP